jgi:hypothetical protein
VKRLKWAAFGVAVVAIFVVAVIGVETLVASSVPVVAGQGSRGYWAEAIQAVSTVVVMAATTVYAVITYQMVQAMKQQTVTMSTAATRAHVTELSRFLTTFINPLNELKASVAPDSRSTVDRIDEQKKAVGRVTTATQQLASFASACPPDIMFRIGPVSNASFRAMAMVTLVDKSIVLAARSAMKGNLTLLEDLLGRIGGLDEGSTPEPRSGSRALDPSWDEVRIAYLLHVRDGEPGKPEWDDIISGKWLDEVYVVWGELITACTAYLHKTQGR